MQERSSWLWPKSVAWPAAGTTCCRRCERRCASRQRWVRCATCCADPGVRTTPTGRTGERPPRRRGRLLLGTLTAMDDQRFAFMLGTGRCGSTIVGQVVAMHDQVGFITNVDDRLAGLNSEGRISTRIYRALRAPLQKQGGRRGGASGSRLASGVRSVAMTPSEGYRLLDRQVSPMRSAAMRDLVAEDASEWLSRRLRSFFERRAAAQGRP